jgi:hypothetical protein
VSQTQSLRNLAWKTGRSEYVESCSCTSPKAEGLHWCWGQTRPEVNHHMLPAHHWSEEVYSACAQLLTYWWYLLSITNRRRLWSSLRSISQVLDRKLVSWDTNKKTATVTLETWSCTWTRTQELYHITSEVDTTSMTYLHKSFKIHTPNQQRPGSYKTSYITIQPTITLTT